MVQMPVPVLNYSTPRDDEAKQRKRLEEFWWLRGIIYSFCWMAAILVMVGFTLGSSARSDSYPLIQSIALFVCGLVPLWLAERKFRRRHHSSAFARGAF